MDKRIEATRALLEERWREHHRIADLAAAVNLAPSRLQHLFKSAMKVSIRELIRQRRLNEAASLILGTYDRISDIAYCVGFQDVSNFNHAFRRQFGMSPREYRGVVGSPDYAQQKAPTLGTSHQEEADPTK